MNRKSGRSARVLGLTSRQIGLLVILVILLLLVLLAILGLVLGMFDEPTAPAAPDVPATPTISTLEETPSPRIPSQEDTPTTTNTPPSPSSETPSPTSTPWTPTLTATQTASSIPPADVCTALELRFFSATTNIAAWRLQNHSGTTLTISRIEIDWPQSNDAIFNVFLNGKVIWSDEDLTPPTIMTTWIGSPEDRSADRLSRVEFFFGTLAAPSGYDVHLWFDNGCEISAAN